MKCFLCKENFFVKRKLLKLFNEEKEYICNKCYKKYPINLNVERCQLDKYDALIISMFDKNYRIDYNVFYMEYSKIFKTYFNRFGYKIFFFDRIRYDDETLGNLDAISKLCNSNLIILTFNIE